ncbi:MAG: cupin domain-containing protein [Acidimicrobiales bacterium]
MTIVPGDRYRFEALPGRRSADPLDGHPPGRSSVRVVVIEPGRRSPHLHPHSEEVVYVMAGRGQIWIDGAFHPVAPGTCAWIPPSVPHATLASAGERVELVCFFPHPDLRANLQDLPTYVELNEET